MDSRKPLSTHIATFLVVFTGLVGLVGAAASLSAQSRSGGPSPDYVIGPQDVLMITSYDQSDLSGKFAVEADGTFTYPLIQRIKASGLTMREFEAALKKRLVDEGYFKNPQITVAIEQYKSQKIFITGEVRQGGPYPLSGDMTLVEAIARAGTLPSASGEVVIVHAAGTTVTGPTLPDEGNDGNVVRIDLRQLQNGELLSQNITLRDGDTIYLPRAETIYVYGEVKNPNAYAMTQKNLTVQQAIALAGGLTNRGSANGMKIIRIENGRKKEITVGMGDTVRPGDTIQVRERFF